MQAQVITSAQIDSLTQLTLKTFDVPGISVAVVKDGKVVHSKGYGVRSLKTNQPMDENTLVGIASNSKAFTASALAMLVDEGKLKWDDKVRDFIPEFKLYNPYVTEEFTIRDLLTHRSGLGLGAGDLMMFPDSSNFTRKDIIHNLRYLKPVSGFRTQYDYDNNLYIAARIEEPEMDKVKAAIIAHDGGVWKDDSLRIFLGTGGKATPYQVFSINSIGTMEETSMDAAAASFNVPWEAEVVREDAAWTVEAAIPFTSLGNVVPKAESVWRGNVCRDRSHAKSLSSWSRTPGSATRR
jgi:hypothetical protein